MTQPSSLSADEDSRDRVARLYEQARALSGAARDEYLRDSCRDDEVLRHELESLLEHGAVAEQFFDRLSDIATATALVSSLTIGRYEIVSCIGVGGMGSVYRARDTQLQRDVALKFLPVHVSLASGAEEQLLTEARTAAALEHVNVCTVHEIGQTDEGLPFIAMAFYEGETLRDRLRRGPLETAQALDIAKQIARGLGAAHARAIVHRDVKPGNVMLTVDGTVKLLDFGLAKVADGNAAVGATPGTVAYMSPEQVRGEAIGPASDLWSLGVVLYEMLTGKQPFRGDDHERVRQAIVSRDPQPISQARADAPEVLQHIVQRLLQKRSQDRYATAAELLADLDTALAIGRPRTARPRRMVLALAGAVGLALATPAVWFATRDTAAPATQLAGRAAATPPNEIAASAAKTIAVLPFTNVSRDPEEEYLSDGLSEELISTLSKMSTMRVVARTSAFALKGANRDIRDIGRALNAARVLEGSVQRAGEQIRVRAQLINAADGLPVWSKTYDQKFSDVFAIQTDLATRIAIDLQAELTSEDRTRLARRATTSAEAFSLYLKGRYFWHQRTRASYRRAIEHFKAAIVSDPRYAAPHAGLGAVYSQQGMNGDLSPAESQRLTRESVRRALALDETLAEAHSVLGVYFHSHEWNMEAALREHLRAVALEPGNATVRNYYGNFLRSVGRFDEAIEEQSLAVQLDPLAPALNEMLAFTLLRVGRTNEAYQRVQDALEIDSTYWRAHAVLGNVYEALDRPQDALRAFERANTLAAAPRTQADIARVYARTGHASEARALVSELKKAAARVSMYEPAVAPALLALGDSNGAQAWLEDGYRMRNPHLSSILGDPRFTPLEQDQRYRDLLRRMGIRYPRGAQQK